MVVMMVRVLLVAEKGFVWVGGQVPAASSPGPPMAGGGQRRHGHAGPTANYQARKERGFSSYDRYKI